MKKILIGVVVILLMCGCTSDVGRYQIVRVNYKGQGASKQFESIIKIDTKTGDTWFYGDFVDSVLIQSTDNRANLSWYKIEDKQTLKKNESKKEKQNETNGPRTTEILE
jgi:hypothetical protein